MSNNIILERSVPVRCWHVLGKVAKTRKRPELMPVLHRAREIGGTDAHDLAEHLLFEPRSRRVVAERLLHITHTYGLVKKKEHEPGAWSIRGSKDPFPLTFLPFPSALGRSPSPYEGIHGKEERNGVFALTEAGETAIDTGEVLVPEYGTWSILESEDPLLPFRILRIDPWRSDKVRAKEHASDRRLVPDWLRDVAGKPVKPAAQYATVVRIDELEGQAEAVDGGLRLRWSVGEGRLQLTGTLDGKQVSSELEAPPMSLDQIRFTLLEQQALIERWDMDRQKLRVTFKETNDTEREAMSKDLEFDSLMIPGYGRFESLTITGVSIMAESAADAQAWAEWRLEARIREYATTERYERWRKKAAAPFGRHEVELPTRTELLRESWKPGTTRPEPRAWHLAAAEDWNL